MPVTADGTTEPVHFNQSSGGQNIAAAWGTFESGSIELEYQMDGKDPNSWIGLATLSPDVPFVQLSLPHGNYRAVVRGSTSPSLSIGIKPC